MVARLPSSSAVPPRGGSAVLFRSSWTNGDTFDGMAKRRASSSTAIVRAFPVRAPAPVIRIAAPRALPAKKTHRRKGGASTGITGKTLIGAGIGGAALGFIEKTFPNLPTMPIIGRTGTIAIAAYMISKRGGGGIARDIALAAAVLTGYQIGKTGTVAGDVMGDVMGDDDVSGLAAQV